MTNKLEKEKLQNDRMSHLHRYIDYEAEVVIYEYGTGNGTSISTIPLEKTKLKNKGDE